MSSAARVPHAKVDMAGTAGTAVVNYDEELARENAAMRDRVGAPSGDKIKVNKDKTFTLPDGSTNPELAVVVANFATQNQFYGVGVKYDSRNYQPPVCQALGAEIKLMKPFAEVSKPQHTECESCWANQFKSDGNGKACKNYRVLALAAPALQAEGPFMILRVSATGIRFWDTYADMVVKKHGGLIKVVTHITFDPNSEHQSLRFAVQAPNPAWKDVFPRRIQALERLLTKPDLGPKEVAEKPRG